MKKKYTLIFSLFFCVTVISQQITKLEWKDDLDSLEYHLLQKDDLFHHFSKSDFKKKIAKLKTNDKGFFLWRINELLSNFKDINLTVSEKENTKYPFEIKFFKNGFYLTKITEKNRHLLGYKLVKINNFTIKEIGDKMKTVFYLPHNNSVQKKLEKKINNKSVLKFLNIVKNDTLNLIFKSTTLNKATQTINLPFIKNFDEDLLVEIRQKKEFFYQRKDNTWFWMYGINFGKQVFLKYNVCASKEHIIKIKDSLKISSQKYAKKYRLSLESVYEAPEINAFIKKLEDKFKNRRYKSLIIDLRNNTKGTFLNSKKIIQKILEIKRINKKKKLFILTNKNINAAAIATILAFKEQTKVMVIGEEVFGTKEDLDKNTYFVLPNSRFKIKYPLNFQEEVIIVPNILVEPTLHQYINGVDALLQKVLEY